MFQIADRFVKMPKGKASKKRARDQETEDVNEGLLVEKIKKIWNGMMHFHLLKHKIGLKL